MSKLCKRGKVRDPITNLCRERTRDEKAAPHPRHAKNIIMYAGSYHIITHGKFLQSIGFEIVDGVRADMIDEPYALSGKPAHKAQCIDMSSMTQPLFT